MCSGSCIQERNIRDVSGNCLCDFIDTNASYRFVYGGRSGGDRAHGELHILTMPGFQWFKVDVNSPERMFHACDYVGGGQMLTSGGLREVWDWNQSDDWPNALGIFDMTALVWKDKYETGLADYDSPQIVKDWYSNGYCSSIPFYKSSWKG